MKKRPHKTEVSLKGREVVSELHHEPRRWHVGGLLEATDAHRLRQDVLAGTRVGHKGRRLEGWAWEAWVRYKRVPLRFSAGVWYPRHQLSRQKRGP
jgi:hypothetical protein